MSLTARGIALQGFLLSPLSIAVQGLLQPLVEEPPIVEQPAAGGGQKLRYGSSDGWHPVRPIRAGRARKQRDADIIFL